MTAPEKELVEQLSAAGKRLLSPPSSVDELLPLLDEVEIYLARVEQSPSQTMQDALSPSRKALVAKELIGHSDTDVKVAVAACISEITRITAPDAPYEDEQMKEIFQLIVSSFERLDDKSSRSYLKRAAILETVAKVRSCVVMLDLECDGLILEMFRHFFRSVRDYHHENVFQSMETIMILVMEESEDIPQDLLLSILENLRKDNKDALPIAQKLGERVLERSAAKVKPYLEQFLKSSGILLDNYIKVVARVIGEVSALEPSDGSPRVKHMIDETVIAKPSSDEEVKEAKELSKEAGSAVEVTNDKPQTVTSNGNLQKGVEESKVVKKSSEDVENDKVIEAKGAGSESKPDDEELLVKIPPRQKSNRKRGRKGSNSKSTSEPSDVSLPEEIVTEKVIASNEDETKGPGSPLCKDTAEDTARVSACDKVSDDRPSSPKTSEVGALEVASPSPSGTTVDESQSERVGQGKKKDDATEEALGLTDKDSRKSSEATDTLELKSDEKLDKELSSKVDNEENTTTSIDLPKKEDEAICDMEPKSVKRRGKKLDSRSNEEDAKNRKGQGKAAADKELAKTPSKDEEKGVVSSPRTKSAYKAHLEKTSNMSSKRKRTPVVEKESESKVVGEDIVGAKIKVYWPMDKTYYVGLISSYEKAKKKHKVVYDDGDVEILNLVKEDWSFVEDDDVDDDSDEGHASDAGSPVVSNEIHKKKRTKRNPESSTKRRKPESSAKRGRGGGASSKSRSKSGRSKQQTDQSDSEKDNEVESMNEDEDDDEEEEKAKDFKGAGKMKDNEAGAPKTSTRSKQETPAKSRGKSTGGRSRTNGAGRSKSSTTPKEKESPAGRTKAGGSGRGGKSTGSSKAAQKSGKKRTRGA